MRKLFQIFRNKRIVLFRGVFVSNIAGSRLIFNEAFELIDDIAKREFALESMLAGRFTSALSHGLSSRRHLGGGAAGAVT